MTDTFRNGERFSGSVAAGDLPKAWPFEEAAKLATRLQKAGKAQALFATGYGPSGLPHIGTFGEVARTSWVRHAFGVLTGMPSRIIAFSDDMDGLRKVPDNVPNRAMLESHLGKPLTRIPDPFGTHESFGAHNNARLQGFLDTFGFDYQFASATDYYTAGRFDEALLRLLEVYDEVIAVILPTLGPERRATYAPILPIHPESGIVMQVALEKIDRAAGTVAWRDPESGRSYETPVTGGHCKLQWKADWAMRWFALGIDYEMSGKDLIDSVRLSGKICRILGAAPPESFTYELFLDENGQKISKSKGNGLSVEDWLRYAPPESLAQFMYNAPQRAKRLYFDVIPRAVDEYLANLERARGQEGAALMANPVWHIGAGTIPDEELPLSFTLLLNLAAVVNAERGDILWSFIRRYAPAATPAKNPLLARLVEHALAYYRDFIRPAKRHRAPNAVERAALVELAAALSRLADAADEAAIQTLLYDIGKRHPFPDLRAWFGTLYQVLLGQAEGPRFGNFVAIYGIPETIALIEAALVRAGDVA
jgi:lysyl-tRNA synthetase class 1